MTLSSITAELAHSGREECFRGKKIPPFGPTIDEFGVLYDSASDTPRCGEKRGQIYDFVAVSYEE
jgi:hypothetical protein